MLLDVDGQCLRVAKLQNLCDEHQADSVSDTFTLQVITSVLSSMGNTEHYRQSE